MKTYQLWLTIFSSVLMSTLGWSLNDVAVLKTWAPTDKLDIVQNLISQEQDEPLARFISKDENKTEFVFGSSFGGLSAVQLDCLQTIKNFNLNYKEKPKVLEIGSGHGHMAWKMITAGAKYNAVDISKEAILQVNERIKQAQQFLLSGENLGDVKLTIGDFTQSRTQERIGDDNSYDVIWASLVLNFIDPLKIKVFLQNIYQKLIPGGIAFITIPAPCAHLPLINVYAENNKHHMPFPGYIAVSFGYTIEHAYQGKGDGKKLGKETIIALATVTNGDKPGKWGHNSYSERGLPKKKQQLSETAYYYEAHNIMNYIDLPELIDFTEEVGFLILNSYYASGDGKRFNSINDEIRSSNNLHSVVKMTKTN